MPKKLTNKEIEDSQILSTAKVDEIIEKENSGIPLHNNEKLWFKNIPAIRKAGLSFAMTDEEVEEYAKCKLSIHYFSENFAKIKLEDGSIGNMKLREYQKEILNLYTKNRYSILMASRQTGKCNSFSTKVLCKNEDSNETITTYLFELYYNTIKQQRPLTLLEKTKLFLYRLYVKI